MRKVLALLVPTVAFGWWDEGHAVGGAIAARSMMPKNLKKVEDLLELWEEQYPGMSNLPVVPVWSDHIKCREPRPWCSHLARYDYLSFLDVYHWTSYTHNFQGVDIDNTIYKFYPLPEVGAQWAMEQMIKDLTFGGEAKPETQGTRLSTNFQLRMLTHLFTDIHNPAHSSEVYSTAHVEEDGTPKGDQGANRWILNTEDCETMKDFPGSPGNLHALWDSVIGLMPDSFPGFTKDDLYKKADELMEEFPTDHSEIKERLDAANGVNIQDVFDDTGALVKEMFREFDWTCMTECNEKIEKNCCNTSKCCRLSNDQSTSTVSPEMSTDEVEPEKCCTVEEGVMCMSEGAKYCPSKEYIKDMEKVAKIQIVLSGYRLGNLLDDIAQHLPTVN